MTTLEESTGMNQVESSSKGCFWVIGYILMMFFTNAYCQVHRWDEWYRQVEREQVNQYGRVIDTQPTTIARTKIVCATAAWPVYWASRASLYLVKQWPAVEVKFVEKRES